MAIKLYDDTPERSSHLYKKATRSSALGKDTQLGKGLATGDVYTSKLNAVEGPQLVANPSELGASDLGLTQHEYNQLSRKDRRELTKMAAAAGFGSSGEAAQGASVGNKAGEYVRRVSDLVEAGRPISANTPLRGAATAAKQAGAAAAKRSGALAKAAKANQVARYASVASGAPLFGKADMDVDSDASQEMIEKAVDTAEKVAVKSASASKRRAEARAAMYAREAAAGAVGSASQVAAAEAAGVGGGSAVSPAVAERAAAMAAKNDAAARSAVRLAARTKVEAARSAAARAAAKQQSGVRRKITQFLQRRRAVTAQALARSGRAAAAAKIGAGGKALAAKGAASVGGGGAAVVAALAPAVGVVLIMLAFLMIFASGEMLSGFGSGGSAIADAAEAEYALYNKETGDGSYAQGGLKYNGDGVTYWCAYFASYCIKQAGVEEAMDLPSGSLQCAYHHHWLAPTGDCYSLARANTKSKYTTVHVNDGTYVPQRGDLAIRCDQKCNTNGPAGCISTATDPAHEGQHVAIVVASESASSYVTIEGNNGNMLNAVGYNWGESEYESPSGTKYRISNPGGINSYDYFVTIKSGGSGNIPEPYGTAKTFENYDRSWLSSAPEGKLHAVWVKKGSKFDSEGFARLDGRYIIACTDKYGKVGDKIDFTLTDGTVIRCIKGDTKNQNDAGCNEWGHDNGLSVIEFCVKKSIWYTGNHGNPGTASCKPEWSARVCNWKNLGSGGYI